MGPGCGICGKTSCCWGGIAGTRVLKMKFWKKSTKRQDSRSVRIIHKSGTDRNVVWKLSEQMIMVVSVILNRQNVVAELFKVVQFSLTKPNFVFQSQVTVQSDIKWLDHVELNSKILNC